jgi:hypothetical protein
MERIQQFIKVLGRESRGILRQAREISFYSRGAWPYDSVLEMTAFEREECQDFLKERFEEYAKLPNLSICI